MTKAVAITVLQGLGANTVKIIATVLGRIGL